MSCLPMQYASSQSTLMPHKFVEQCHSTVVPSLHAVWPHHACDAVPGTTLGDVLSL